MSRAPDIADFEKMLNDGEGDDALCKRAIEIGERLQEEREHARRFARVSDAQRTSEELDDFVKVLKQIEHHRHRGALNEFDEYMQKYNFLLKKLLQEHGLIRNP